MARFSFTTLGLVVVGGIVGVSARAGLTLTIGPDAHPLLAPTVTMLINLAGSFLLGVTVGRLGGRHPRWQGLLGTGMLGGFTTYSAFAVQFVTTATDAPLVGLLLAAGTLFGGVVLAGVGFVISGGPSRVASTPLTDEDAQ